MLLWNPEDFQIRQMNKKYYDALYDAGILYYIPELCAEKINLIYKNPMEWWESNDIQAAKDYFCNNMCRTADNIVCELAKVINDMRKN